MEILEGIRTRRTTRKFSKEPVEFEKVMAICEAGSLAPSSGNVQSWKFVVIRDKKTIRGPLFHACLDQECVQQAQVVVLVCADEALVEREYGLRGKRLYAIQNSAAAIQNMLLAAHALGLGAAWIGAFNEERIRAMFKVPENARPQAIIPIGYPAEKPDDKRYRGIDDVVRFDVYPLRYRDVHRTLLDLSEEWEMQIAEAKERFEPHAENLKKKAKEFLEKVQGMVTKDKKPKNRVEPKPEEKTKK